MPVADLQSLRERIEALDRELLSLLKERMAIVEGVAGAKLVSASPFRDPQREEQVLQRVRHIGVELGLDAHRVESLYRAIMEMSIAANTSLATTAVAVVFSTGKNAATGGTGADEAKNLDADRAFVFHERAPTSAANGEFDDLVTWLSSSILFNRLVAAGVI